MWPFKKREHPVAKEEKPEKEVENWVGCGMCYTHLYISGDPEGPQKGTDHYRTAHAYKCYECGETIYGIMTPMFYKHPEAECGIKRLEKKVDELLGETE